jgi:hypothetical protein
MARSSRLFVTPRWPEFWHQDHQDEIFPCDCH